MNRPEQAAPDARDTQSLILLVSAAFFSLYLFAALSVMFSLVPGFSSGFMVFIREFNFFYKFDSLFLFSLIMIASFIASIILVKEQRRRALPWQAWLPLTIVLGIIAVSVTVFTFAEPSDPVRRNLGIALVGEIIGYALLPAATAALLYSRTKVVGTASWCSVAGVSIIGVAGMLFMIDLLVTIITTIPSQAPPHYDIFQFDEHEVLVLIGALVYAAVLLPVAGGIFLKTWLSSPDAGQENPVNDP